MRRISFSSIGQRSSGKWQANWWPGFPAIGSARAIPCASSGCFTWWAHSAAPSAPSWANSPRRYLNFDCSNDPTIQHTTWTSPIGTLSFGGSTLPGSATISVDPIPPEKRISADSLWSRCPFQLKEDYIWSADPTNEGYGIDLLLPYWTQRWQGAIK